MSSKACPANDASSRSPPTRSARVRRLVWEAGAVRNSWGVVLSCDTVVVSFGGDAVGAVLASGAAAFGHHRGDANPTPSPFEGCRHSRLGPRPDAHIRRGRSERLLPRGSPV